MFSNYTFLNDHSYSLRPVVDDNDDLSLNNREDKNKNRRRSSNRTNKTTSTTTRTVSIDRSSSDKENNSLILSNSSNASIPVPNNSLNTNTRVNKKTSNVSRVSPRTAMINSRTQSGKKSTSKTNVKSTSGSIIKKKKVINQNKTQLLNSNDVLPSLSIEERVKLRRTKPIQPSTIIVEKKSTKINKKKISTVQHDIKQIHQSKEKISPTKTKKLFLGSGLDLDNIVLGNRQRRCVRT